MKIRMRSDVPIAFCLSGGIDSASLVSISTKKLGVKAKTFSIIDNDPRYNESDNIMETVKTLDVKIRVLNLKNIDFIGHLKKLISYHSSPISTISYFVHSLISKEASQQGFKVIISGTGADELFTGYYDHYLYHFLSLSSEESYNKNLEFWKKILKKNIKNFQILRSKSFSVNY